MRNHYLRLGKFFFIGICFWIIATSVDFVEVLSAYEGYIFVYICVSFAFLLADTLLLTHRCRILLLVKQVQFKFFSLIRIVYISNFLSIAIPSSLGPDVLRIMMLRKENCPLQHATSVMIMDRVLSVLSMAILALPGLFIVLKTFPGEQITVPLIAMSFCTVCCAVLLMSSFPTIILQWIASLLHRAQANAKAIFKTILLFLSKTLHIFVEVHQSFYNFRARPLILASSFGWHILNQIFRVFQVHFLFLALGQSVPLTILFAYVPIIIIATMLPISYFGLGIREGAFIFFFSRYGIPAEICLAVSFLSYLLILASMLPGALLVIWSKSLDRRAT